MSEFKNPTDVLSANLKNSTTNNDDDSNNSTFSSSISGIITFEKPKRKIFNQNDLNKFIESSIYKDILSFIQIAADAITGCALSENINVSSYTINTEEESIESQAQTQIEKDNINSFVTVRKLCNFLNLMYNEIDNCPPLPNAQRYGNKAFRHWHDNLKAKLHPFLLDIVPTEAHGAIIELETYLLISFGNETRIDYGTGHETNFIIFMICLLKLDMISKEYLRHYVLEVFSSYIRTCRRLQTVYFLEPAGSHGVWGLDDYHCILFLWGAAQLRGHISILPNSINDDDVVNENSNQYFYLEGIQFIKKIKTGAVFAETSPMLHSIASSPHWNKIYVGIVRLYQGEVLKKFPVCQHFVFGGIMKAAW